jgi:hypothetical protein
LALSLNDYPKRLAFPRRNLPPLRCLFHVLELRKYEGPLPYSGSHCFYCGIKMVEPPSGQIPPRFTHLRAMRTRDHIIPRSKLKSEFSVCVDACHLCNQTKADSTLEEFRAFVAMMMHKKVEDVVFFGEK